ncbi:hypothetical protein U1Q18_009790 [Sarracenia purpurea var. burkii]
MGEKPLTKISRKPLTEQREDVPSGIGGISPSSPIAVSKLLELEQPSSPSSGSQAKIMPQSPLVLEGEGAVTDSEGSEVREELGPEDEEVVLAEDVKVENGPVPFQDPNSSQVSLFEFDVSSKAVISHVSVGYEESLQVDSMGEGKVRLGEKDRSPALVPQVFAKMPKTNPDKSFFFVSSSSSVAWEAEEEAATANISPGKRDFQGWKQRDQEQREQNTTTCTRN